MKTKTSNKIYEKIKNYIKNNYKFLIIYIFLLLLVTIRLDYEVYMPGGLTNLAKRITVENAKDKDGSFNLTYVKAKPGTIPIILLSYIIPSWDLYSLDDQRIDSEDANEIMERGKIDLTSSGQIAVKTAFDKAGVDYEKINEELIVYHVFDNANTNLEVGDIITKVDEVNVKTFEDFSKIISEKNENDEIKLTIIKNGKEKEKYATVKIEEGKKIIGLYLTETFEIKSDKKIKFKYKSSEAGSSGGLMTTLEIYNRLIDEDITKGLKIAGTGTINLDGTVGEIGGVKYKLKGAVKNGADVFIVPTNNYKEALEVKEKEGYKIKLIEAKTFEGVLADLSKL